MTNALWLFPTRFAATSYALRVLMNGVTETLTFPAAGSLNTTLDYWPSGDGQTGTESDGTGRADLVAMLEATLQTHSEGGLDVTVAIDTSNYLVTIDHASADVKVLWTDAATTLDAYAPAWGWTGTADTELAGTVSGTYTPKGMLRWGVPPSVDSRDRQPVIAAVARALSGARRTSVLEVPSKERRLSWALLAASKALREHATPSWACAEEAWLSALALGRCIRHYEDEADVTGASGYVGYSLRDVVEPIARNSRYQVLWDASFALVREFAP